MTLKKKSLLERLDLLQQTKRKLVANKELSDPIAKWRELCQAATLHLYQQHQEQNEKKLLLSEFVKSCLGFGESDLLLLKFNEELDEFDN